MSQTQPAMSDEEVTEAIQESIEGALDYEDASEEQVEEFFSEC